jgi:hypothetical protein
VKEVQRLNNDMKKHLLFISRIIVLMAVSFLSLGCKEQDAVVPASATTPAPISNVLLVSPTAVFESESTLNPPPEKNYEVISSTVIRKDNITFEISGVANPRHLQIFMNAAASEMPESYLKGNLVENITFEPTTTPQLALESSGGGGGFGLENNKYVVNQEFSYTIKNPLSKGQMIHIAVAVTFNGFTGIVHPVVFEFDIFVE